MKALYVIRHGIAEKPDADVDDEARELTGKGRERMKLVAKGLEDSGVRFDIILTSPLARASQTADIIRKYCSPDADMEVTGLLKPVASVDELIERLNTIEGADSVAIVGHEPFLSSFVSYCLSGKKSSFIQLKKGGIALLETDGDLQPGQCALVWLLEPGQLAQL